MTAAPCAPTLEMSAAADGRSDALPVPTAAHWHVYMVRCADGTLYTGVAKDLASRINAHNTGAGAKYTRSRLPVALVYHEPAPDRSAAQQRERAIKRLTAHAKRRLVDSRA